ncbi:probable esterase KAI2 [Oryza brachyantha]|uniref:AB hydrolase-1 domain-containing protein n=1 Tax=Oryza brachyantha TaxID=4533 RepID=J3MAB2_ORYBR|nr:probable esterase KAI2 [Oryza brachyantha]
MNKLWRANARVVGSGREEEGAVSLVLAHGYGASQAVWDKLVPSLSQRHKLLLFDWNFTATGAGNEAAAAEAYTFGRFADELIAVMEERGVGASGALVVAHSMSAMAACIAAAKRPDLFAHIFLVCASPRYINSEEEGYVGGFDEAAIHGMLAAMESDFQGWVESFVPNAAGDASAVEHLSKSFLAMDPTVALELAKMIFLGDQREVLDGVKTPCTIVQVKADFAAPPSVAEYMHLRMKGTAAAVEIIDSVGHFPQLVAPQQLLDILDGVLRLREEAEAEHDAGTVGIAGGIDVAM